MGFNSQQILWSGSDQLHMRRVRVGGMYFHFCIFLPQGESDCRVCDFFVKWLCSLYGLIITQMRFPFSLSVSAGLTAKVETQEMEGTSCFCAVRRWRSQRRGGQTSPGSKEKATRAPAALSQRETTSSSQVHSLTFERWGKKKKNNNSPVPGSCTRHCSCETRERGSAVFSWTFDSWWKYYFCCSFSPKKKKKIWYTQQFQIWHHEVCWQRSKCRDILGEEGRGG